MGAWLNYGEAGDGDGDGDDDEGRTDPFYRADHFFCGGHLLLLLVLHVCGVAYCYRERQRQYRGLFATDAVAAPHDNLRIKRASRTESCSGGVAFSGLLANASEQQQQKQQQQHQQAAVAMKGEPTATEMANPVHNPPGAIANNGQRAPSTVLYNGGFGRASWNGFS